jgi:hypothetical protein
MARVSKAERNAFILATAEIMGDTANRESGRTLTEIQQGLAIRGISRSKSAISAVIHDLRMFYADYGVYVEAVNQKDGSEWAYRLVTNEHNGAEWADWNLGAAVTRLDTIVAYFDYRISIAESDVEQRNLRMQRQALVGARNMISV